MLNKNHQADDASPQCNIQPITSIKVEETESVTAKVGHRAEVGKYRGTWSKKTAVIYQGPIFFTMEVRKRCLQLEVKQHCAQNCPVYLLKESSPRGDNLHHAYPESTVSSRILVSLVSLNLATCNAWHDRSLSDDEHQIHNPSLLTLIKPLSPSH